MFLFRVARSALRKKTRTLLTYFQAPCGS